MIWYVILLTLIPSFRVNSQGSVNIPTFSNSVSDIQAARGYDARIYCQINNKGDNDLYWNCISKTVDVTIGPNENTNSALKRYVIDDSAADLGYYNLIIDKVSSTDNGTCSCIIIDKNQGTQLRSEGLLIVEDEAILPSTLDCASEKLHSLVQSNTTFLENEQVRLTCTSNGGVPLSHLQWEIVRPGSKEPEIIYSYVNLNENSITATVNYTVSRFDNGAHFKCIQNHVLFPNAAECIPPNGAIEPIVVLYAPVLRFEPETVKASDESGPLTVTCKYEAEPSDLRSGPTIQFIPQIPGETLNFTYTNGQKDSVKIYLHRSDVGKKLTCTASNQIGKSDIELVVQEDFSSSEVPVLVLSIVGAILFVIVIAGCIVFCIYTYDNASGKSNSERGDALSHRTDSNANIVEMTVEREHIQRSNGTLSRVESQRNGRQYEGRMNQPVSNGSATLPTNARRGRQRPHSFHEGSMTTGRRKDIPPSYSETELDSLPNARPTSINKTGTMKNGLFLARTKQVILSSLMLNQR